jgi:hypothetical protein
MNINQNEVLGYGRDLLPERPVALKKPLNEGVLGSFKYVDDLTAALDKLKAAGEKNYTVFSPVPLGEVRGELATPTSPIRRFTITGGIIGCLTGFALTILTSMHWPLRTSGKPIVSLPPFMIICFELTILFGALCTLLGLITFCIYPGLTFNDPYSEEFSKDTFGIFVKSAPDRHSKIEGILKEAGAHEVRFSKN